jgi:hypothetical protein
VTSLPHRAVLFLVVAATVVAGLGTLPPTSAAAAGPSATAQVKGAVDPLNPRTWRRTAPGSYTPGSGPTFNNPYGTQASKRRILTMMVRAINSVPGYARPKDPVTGNLLPCPERNHPEWYPATIKISLYSIADRGFVDSLIAADRRCVSVQLLMNNHLDENTSPSWGRLLHAIGNDRSQRSWTRRCIGGCRGHAVLHSKFYLFSQVGRARNVAMVGSSNMTSNAVRVQWNDLYTAVGNGTLVKQYTGIFNEMKRDTPVANPMRVYRTGNYTSTFYPFPSATARTDKTMAALNTIRCTGARGAGINGRSVLYINMHSWHGTRGKYLAQRVRTMYNRGCYVRILYSFMGHGTYTLLTKGTGSRMIARRVLFPGPAGVVAAKYSHMKMFAAAGYIAGDPSNWVTWTGSNNWADRSIKADEVTLRIASRGVYGRYVDHWNAMRARRSSATWAIYEEPSGGGRAPEE